MLWDFSELEGKWELFYLWLVKESYCTLVNNVGLHLRAVINLTTLKAPKSIRHLVIDRLILARDSIAAQKI